MLSIAHGQCPVDIKWHKITEGFEMRWDEMVRDREMKGGLGEVLGRPFSKQL